MNIHRCIILHTLAAAALTFSASAQAAPVVLFQDDLEGGSLGDLPGAPAVGLWTVETNDEIAPGDPVWKLVDSPQGTAPNDNTTQFARTGRFGGRAVTYAGLSDPTLTAGQRVHVSLDFYIPTASTALWIYGSDDPTGLSSAGRSFDLRLGGNESNSAGLEAGGIQVRDDETLSVINDVFTPDAWQHLLIRADHGSGTFDILINDSLVASGIAFEDSPTTLGSVRISGLSDSGGEPTDFVYIDNLTVTAIPEPASLALMGTGALLLLRRRK